MKGAVATVLPSLVAIVGLAVAALSNWLTYRQRSDELYFNTLDWLTGKTQRRNVGIAAIEAHWSDRRFKSLSISPLVNQAIYLLLWSDQRESEHELDNLYRIMDLLLSVERDRIRDDPQLHARFQSLREALAKAQTTLGTRKKGLKVPTEKLETWDERLRALF